MTDTPNLPNDSQSGSGLFTTSAGPKSHSGMPWQTWAIAGAACLIVLIVLLVTGYKKHSAQASGPDPYIASLAISNVVMSESDIPAGGKLTYIDGTVTNNGVKIVTQVTVQTSFVNDMGQPPQVEKQPIQLIRTREPYIDTVPVSASPIKPGESRDFRLTFEQVTPNWNQTTPPLQVVGAVTR
jgi:hypothetical protein